MKWDQFFRADALAVIASACVVFYTLLTIIYSVGYMRGRKGLVRYYVYLVVTAVLSIAAVMSDNLVLFMTFWGLLALFLYLLINQGAGAQASQTAKKTFIIIGGTDTLMLLGLAFVWALTEMPELSRLAMTTVSIPVATGTAVAAYLLLLSGTLAKAGAMPFHTWVPDMAENAPLPTVAFLPASLDKLVGIYFLLRLNLDMFVLRPGMQGLLMFIGSFTIIAAVMMALVQHDLRRLLGYHAVSQVGYMVLGIATGVPLGIAGGTFHMLNHTLYKTGLFFAGGAVIHDSGTGDLDKLGGYARKMPIVFWSFFVCALAIAGVPPLNGFVSKWMIYQSLVQTGESGGGLWPVWLAAAMFGSALTLASFMKVLYAVFLAPPAGTLPEKEEASPFLWSPPAILAAVCVVFGVLAFRLPLRYLIDPVVDMPMAYSGDWHSVVGAVLILLGLLVGIGVYAAGKIFKTRTVEPFIGGEVLANQPHMRLSGVDFYLTVEKAPFLKTAYEAALKKAFDVYELGTKATFGVSKVFSGAHSGELQVYLAWCLLGMIVLLLMMMGWSP
ncbi:MAG: complex I subunit 5 family protein [Candidatus Hydrogenedentota bacterium]